MVSGEDERRWEPTEICREKWADLRIVGRMVTGVVAERADDVVAVEARAAICGGGRGVGRIQRRVDQDLLLDRGFAPVTRTDADGCSEVATRRVARNGDPHRAEIGQVLVQPDERVLHVIERHRVVVVGGEAVLHGHDGVVATSREFATEPVEGVEAPGGEPAAVDRP